MSQTTAPGAPHLPDTTPERDQPRPPGLRWWKEAITIVVLYIVYSTVRNQFGSAAVDADVARDNALRIIDAERALRLYVEPDIQSFFIDWTWFMQAWNVFYGTFHFVVTAGVLVWLFRVVPARYPRWRNTLAWTTLLALIGFATFPLMPPRLLPESYGYIDSLAEIGGLWSFDEGPVASISNQYAAMPSLHFGWSTWCLLAVLPVLRSRRAKILFSLYPLATLFAIIVTANHFWLDAVGGALVLSLGYIIGSAQDEWRISRQSRQSRQSPAPA